LPSVLSGQSPMGRSHKKCLTKAKPTSSYDNYKEPGNCLGVSVTRSYAS
jgi:hypothetical protein